MTSILNIKPGEDNDSSSLREQTTRNKDKILSNLGINTDGGIISKIKKYITNILNTEK